MANSYLSKVIKFMKLWMVFVATINVQIGLKRICFGGTFLSVSNPIVNLSGSIEILYCFLFPRNTN